jgi:transposase
MVTDHVWERIDELLEPLRGPIRAGRPPIADRAALTGILHVLQTGISWQELPRQLKCGSGMTCWRRLRRWENAGIWPSIQDVLVDNLPQSKKIDWMRVYRTRQTVS